MTIFEQIWSNFGVKRSFYICTSSSYEHTLWSQLLSVYQFVRKPSSETSEASSYLLSLLIMKFIVYCEHNLHNKFLASLVSYSCGQKKNWYKCKRTFSPRNSTKFARILSKNFAVKQTKFVHNTDLTGMRVSS